MERAPKSSLRRRDWSLLIDRCSNNVHDASKSVRSDRDLNRSSEIANVLSADKSLSCLHGNSTDSVLTKMLSDLEDETILTGGNLNLKCVENLGKSSSVELNIDDGTNDLSDSSSIEFGTGVEAASGYK
jgi:hypothetical protein